MYKSPLVTLYVLRMDYIVPLANTMFLILGLSGYNYQYRDSHY